MTDMITEVPGFQESQPPVEPPAEMIEAVPADMKASIDATAAAEQAKREEQQAATESVATDISTGAEAVGLPPTTPYAETNSEQGSEGISVAKAAGIAQERIAEAGTVQGLTTEYLSQSKPGFPKGIIDPEADRPQPLPAQPEAPPEESTNNQ